MCAAVCFRVEVGFDRRPGGARPNFQQVWPGSLRPQCNHTPCWKWWILKKKQDYSLSHPSPIHTHFPPLFFSLSFWLLPYPSLLDSLTEGMTRFQRGHWLRAACRADCDTVSEHPHLHTTRVSVLTIKRVKRIRNGGREMKGLQDVRRFCGNEHEAGFLFWLCTGRFLAWTFSPGDCPLISDKETFHNSAKKKAMISLYTEKVSSHRSRTFCFITCTLHTCTDTKICASVLLIKAHGGLFVFFPPSHSTAVILSTAMILALHVIMAELILQNCTLQFFRNTF